MQIPTVVPLVGTVILPKESGEMTDLSGENGKKGFDRFQVIGL